MMTEIIKTCNDCSPEVGQLNFFSSILPKVSIPASFIWHHFSYISVEVFSAGTGTSPLYFGCRDQSSIDCL
jgi:hypothetical protein